jgi:carboxylate-amine ligase
VHVGISDRDLAVEVLARLRPWLPALLALSVNSPFAGGTDSGWSSTRYLAQLRWPTFRPPPASRNAERYDETVRALITSGAAMDHASVYFLARLSVRYPTVEVRVADACLTTEDTVLLAGVVRALIATLVEDARRAARMVPPLTARVSAGLLGAAHHGLSPVRGRSSARPVTAAAHSVGQLMTKIGPALEAAGDVEAVHDGLERLRLLGTGADRQRAMWAQAATPAEFVASLADATVPVALLR